MGQSDYRNNIGMAMVANMGRRDRVQRRPIYGFFSNLHFSVARLSYASSSIVRAPQCYKPKPIIRRIKPNSSPPDCQLDAEKTGCGYSLLSSMACCTIPSCLVRRVNGVTGMNTIEREENCGRGAFDLGNSMSSHDFVSVLAETSASVNSSISRVLVAVLPPLPA